MSMLFFACEVSEKCPSDLAFSALLHYFNNISDLMVILSHIGFDKDQELAPLLKPEYGVDRITVVP